MIRMSEDEEYTSGERIDSNNVVCIDHKAMEVHTSVPEDVQNSHSKEVVGRMDQIVHHWKRIVWHGGSVYDAWFNAVSGQVGQVILSMPSSYSQMGFALGVFFHLLYATVGCWTCYLLACLYLEYRARKERDGVVFKKHIIQYHEVMGYLVGPWLRRISLFFNITTMAAVAVVQIIACASNAYYLNSSINKREWTLIFGAISTLTVLLPSFHNFRVWSIIGVLTTTYTAWYMFIASLIHGQVKNVKHSAPDNLEKFFTGTTNILFAFGGHAITIEIMHAMWKPKKYKYVYLITVLYVLTITIPHSVTVYWAFGDELLKKSNAFAVLPSSTFRSIGLVFMIIHQAIAFGLYIMPLNFMWEKLLGVHESNFLIRIVVRIPVALLLLFFALLIPFFGPLNSIIGSLIMSFSVFIIPSIAYIIVFRNSTVRKEAAEKPAKWLPSWKGIRAMNSTLAVLIFILGFCFGSWASIKNLAHQVDTFGVFGKCYQCSSN